MKLDSSYSVDISSLNPIRGLVAMATLSLYGLMIKKWKIPFIAMVLHIYFYHNTEMCLEKSSIGMRILFKWLILIGYHGY